jgi:hypothetical protein
MLLRKSKEKTMSMPAGVVKKTKNNDNKKYRENAEWQTGKKLGRKKQKFNAETNSWEKVGA